MERARGWLVLLPLASCLAASPSLAGTISVTFSLTSGSGLWNSNQSSGQAKEHPFHCGRFGTFFLSSFKRRNSKRAEFVTHLNGDVVITTKGCSHLQLEYGLTKRFQETVPYPRVMCPPPLP